MEKIDFTLISDGTSDRCLIPVLTWSLRRIFSEIPINGEWADLSRLESPPKQLSHRIHFAAEAYPSDLLFIHRDAEKQNPQPRYEEIHTAIAEIKRVDRSFSLPHICVVPIRMTEAWLLFDEIAIRKAAGNPNGTIRLELPEPRSVEKLPDPKEVLCRALTTASELQGRHLKRFNPEHKRFLVTENIDDFTPLFKLAAFKRLQEDIERFKSEAVR